ncbi:MAG: hypothetical protein U5L07_03390 [Desulfobacterales bacterium]|nr:hypothetical protein [Desulfobacterales bacterium]
MIVIPKEKPVIEGLNSYYLKVDKLMEHYQGALESGGIYFHAPTAEAVVYFDDENVLNGFYKDKKNQIKGQAAIDRIVQAATGSNFSVSVYRIQADRLYYWANLANSKALYNDLSSEFTDLEALIKKMESEKLTGYIDVKLNENAGGGVLFFYNGEVIGGASARGKGDVDRSREYRDDLISRCRQHGGVFNVWKTDLATIASASQSTAKKSAGRAEKSGQAKPAASAERKRPSADEQRVLQMLQSLLSLLESVVRSNKKIRTDFETMLNRKFVEKVDKYDFLDPFAGDFKYANGQLFYTGDAPQTQLVSGVVECVREIVSELGIAKSFRKYLASWHKEYIEEIYAFNVEI